MGACAARESTHSVAIPSTPSQTRVGQLVLGQVLGTFLLTFIWLIMREDRRSGENTCFGFVIGMLVTVMESGIRSAGHGAFNPAIRTSSILQEYRSDVWICWLACPLGAVLAACFDRALRV